MGGTSPQNIYRLNIFSRRPAINLASLSRLSTDDIERRGKGVLLNIFRGDVQLFEAHRKSPVAPPLTLATKIPKALRKLRFSFREARQNTPHSSSDLPGAEPYDCPSEIPGAAVTLTLCSRDYFILSSSSN